MWYWAGRTNSTSNKEKKSDEVLMRLSICQLKYFLWIYVPPFSGGFWFWSSLIWNRLLGQVFKPAITNRLAAYRQWKHNTDSTFKVDMTNLLPINTSCNVFSSCSCFVDGLCIRMVRKSVLFTHYFGNYRLELSKLSSEHEPKCLSWPQKSKQWAERC